MKIWHVLIWYFVAIFGVALAANLLAGRFHECVRQGHGRTYCVNHILQ